MGTEHTIYPDVEKSRDRIGRSIREIGTPVAICDKSILTARFETLKRCMTQSWPSTQIAYSFKTNYDVAKSGVFKELGAFAEVVSAREYALARELGYPGSQIIFNGPYKDDGSLRAAIDERAIINVNDQEELRRIIEIANSRREIVSVGIRVSSTLEGFGHSRFGFSMENGEATEAVDAIKHAEFVNIAGLHSHVYGDTDDEKVYATAANRAAEFAKEHIENVGGMTRFFNMGGGFPANTPQPYSRKTWRPQDIKIYVGAIADALKRSYRASGTSPILILEPGRYLVNDAIMLITNIVHIQDRDGKQIVNTNGSISMVPLTHYRPQVIQAYDGELERRIDGYRATIIYGATCRENDVLFSGEFPSVEPGDILIHFGVGAYNSSLSPAFIFDQPPTIIV